jgi:hypothetical protein
MLTANELPRSKLRGIQDGKERSELRGILPSEIQGVYRSGKIHLAELRGEALLQPIAEIPASELWLFRNPEAINEVREGLGDASQGKISQLDPEELNES